MEQKKAKFFIRLKDSIFNFDKYREFVKEKSSIAVKFFFKLIIVISLIITIALTFKVIDIINKTKVLISEQIPEFKVENNNLVIDNEKKSFIIDQYKDFAILINSETENIEEIQESNNYKNILAILKDKMVVKIENEVTRTITYQEFNETNIINKQNVLQALSSENLLKIELLFALVVFIVSFIVFSIQIIFDILVLSIIAFLLNLILVTKLEYKSTFNISVYSMALSILLYMIYIIVNILTGFNIIYFDIAYKAISYIYIITALLTIRSDIIKQNMELTKIIQVQKEVRKELEEKKEEEKNEKKENKKEKEKSKKDKEDNTDGKEPEGNQA